MRLEQTLLLHAIRKAAIVTAALLTLSPMLAAQSVPVRETGLGYTQSAPFELTIGYSYLHANAPAGMCGCFSMNQGIGTFAYNGWRGFGAVADVSGGHVNNVSGTPQSISIINYLAGPRYSWKLGSSRYTPYGEVLAGGSTELSNYAYAQSLKGFAFMPGGGVKVRLRAHLGVNVEAGWVHSEIANNANNRQNDIRIATGITFRFAPR